MEQTTKLDAAAGAAGAACVYCGNRAGYPGPTGRPWPGWYPQARRSTPFFKPARGIRPPGQRKPLPLPANRRHQQGAAVRRLAEGVDLFLLDQEADLAGLKQLALAARQLRGAWQHHDRSGPPVSGAGADGSPRPAGADGPDESGLFQLLRIINNMADAEQYLAGALPNRETTALGGFFGEILEKAAAWEKKPACS